jgi:alanine racemase
MARSAIARIHSSNLQYNYERLKQIAKEAEIMSIVKADAYGHGLKNVVPSLLECGCRHFGVTDANEGACLRNLLTRFTQMTTHVEITLLSGIFDQEDVNLSKANNLMPVITELDHLDMLVSGGFMGSVWIKVNTGMNRIGALNPTKLYRECLAKGVTVRGLMTHLACADEPQNSLNDFQLKKFQGEFKDMPDDLPRSVLNSAGLVSFSSYRFDVVRPGIALYGSEPSELDKIGLKPVMSLIGKIIQIRKVSKGEAISYGASFVPTKDMRVAIVSLGYADGLPRALSNQGHAIVNEHKVRIVGRICMDYTLIDVSGLRVTCGDEVEFWGENVLADDLADMLNTISYELVTGVGQRVKRVKQ